MDLLGMLAGSAIAQILGGTASDVLRSDESRVRSLATKLGISEADARQLRIDLAGEDDSRLPAIAAALHTTDAEARRVRAEFHGVCGVTQGHASSAGTTARPVRSTVPAIVIREKDAPIAQRLERHRRLLAEVEADAAARRRSCEAKFGPVMFGVIGALGGGRRRGFRAGYTDTVDAELLGQLTEFMNAWWPEYRDLWAGVEDPPREGRLTKKDFRKLLLG